MRVDDLHLEQRWPQFTPRGLRTGLLSTLSAPVSVDGAAWGALNVYSSRTSAFSSDRAAEVLQRLAGHISALASGASRPAGGSDETLTVRSALERRDAITRAIGMLMERHGVSADDAFNRLSDLSAEQQVPLRVVAERLETGRAQQQQDGPSGS